jgi:hypothetical protein
MKDFFNIKFPKFGLESMSNRRDGDINARIQFNKKDIIRSFFGDFILNVMKRII